MRIKRVPVRNAGTKRLLREPSRPRMVRNVKPGSRLHITCSMLYTAYYDYQFPLTTAIMKQRYGYDIMVDHGNVICKQLEQRLKVIQRVKRGTYVLTDKAHELFDQLIEDGLDLHFDPDDE